MPIDMCRNVELMHSNAQRYLCIYAPLICIELENDTHRVCIWEQQWASTLACVGKHNWDQTWGLHLGRVGPRAWAQNWDQSWGCCPPNLGSILGIKLGACGPARLGSQLGSTWRKTHNNEHQYSIWIKLGGQHGALLARWYAIRIEDQNLSASAS